MQFVQFPPDVLILPETHFAHIDMDEAPGTAENRPALHGLQPDSCATPFADEYFPAEQFLHVVMSSAPTELLQVPFLHDTHSVLSGFA